MKKLRVSYEVRSELEKEFQMILKTINIASGLRYKFDYEIKYGLINGYGDRSFQDFYDSYHHLVLYDDGWPIAVFVQDTKNKDNLTGSEDAQQRHLLVFYAISGMALVGAGGLKDNYLELGFPVITLYKGTKKQ